MKFLVQQQPANVATSGATRTPPSDDFDAGLPTLLFIHGAANDHSVWLTLLRQLSEKTEQKRVNLLAVDLPGHGETFSEAKTTVEGYADWIINLLDNGAIASATLIGHSMGGLIALDCARRYPSRVAKLVLIGTVLPMPVSAVLMQAAQEKPDEAFGMLTKWSHYLVKNADGSFPPATDAMKEDLAMLRRSRPGVLATDLAACAAYQPDLATVAKISIPTLIIAGAKDKLAPPSGAQALVQAMPAIAPTVLVLEDTGHALMQQASAQLPSLIADWVRT
jgi:pimeloyl-ACP methyl ester carboxylesterase